MGRKLRAQVFCHRKGIQPVTLTSGVLAMQASTQARGSPAGLTHGRGVKVMTFPDVSRRRERHCIGRRRRYGVRLYTWEGSTERARYGRPNGGGVAT